MMARDTTDLQSQLRAVAHVYTHSYIELYAS